MLGARGAPVEPAVDELVNDLVTNGRPAAIVFDDLNAVTERPLRSIAHATKRLSANARLLTSTRSDPGRRLESTAGRS